MEKYCYICIPIAGRENDVFERAEIAKLQVKKLGYKPICPLDLNKIGEKELVNHTEIQMTAWYMGRDIDMIIRDCDAIYCCEGWECSKGCNVERECAKQYSRDILYQVPYDTRKDVKLYEAIESVKTKLVNTLCDEARQEIPDKDYINVIKRDITEFEKMCKKYFNYTFNDINKLSN
jgi:hypothetical protein